MGVSDLQFDTNAGPVVDLSAQGLQKLDPNFTCSEDTHTLILDRNHIMKLDHMERNPGLQQLSVASNRLVRMMGVSQLTELRVLNLPNNSIDCIEGLRDMPHLRWLNLSDNNIKVIEQLNNCVSLQHLDLSDNNISVIGDLTKLVELKTLLLHGNGITTLRTVPAHLPTHLSILSLAQNEIRDLSEVCYLAPLHVLEQLSIMTNPCIMARPSLPGFDYRPYIMNWILSLKVLDGYAVSQKEGLKAEWLYSQGKGRSYWPGQHVQLVQYLATVCPLTSSPALQAAEDAKLEKILRLQRFHQKQLLEESRRGCPGPPRPTQLDVEKHSPSHVASQEGAREMKNTTAPASAAAQRAQDKEPVMQFNTWVTSNASQTSLPVIHSPRHGEELLYLENVQTDDDKLNSGMLSSESTFIPLTSDIEPQPGHSDNEDETETFKPVSLAPKYPPQKEHRSPSSDKQNRVTMVQEVISAAGFHGSRVARVCTPQNEIEMSSEGEKAEKREAPKQEKVVNSVTNSNLDKSQTAAVKIQSWQRGQYTRCHHPMITEVRSEIQLRRMQDHIVFLSEKLDRVQQQYEEERFQRMNQDEAVKFLSKQLKSMQQWKQSVEQQLVTISRPSETSPLRPREVAVAVASSTTNPAGTDISFPDSGFDSTIEQQGAQEDSFLSSGTADSLKTVRALRPRPWRLCWWKRWRGQHSQICV